MKRIGRYGFLSLAFAATIASAQDQKATGYVEVGGGASKVTNGQGDWSGAYLRGSYGFPKKDIVNFEVRSAKRFRDDGFYFGFLWTHYVQPDVYTSFGVGGSTGGFFFPKVRVDGSVSKIWGAKQDVVTTVGATYNQARDTYYDWAGFFDLTYYVANVVFQLGTRYNVSYPGSAKSWSGYGAISLVKAKDYMLTFRYGGGRESYLPLGGTLTPVDFSSTTYSVGLRKWLNNDWGFNATYEWYTNPNYKRNGFELGVFRDF